jgi:hypothetical protein
MQHTDMAEKTEYMDDTEHVGITSTQLSDDSAEYFGTDSTFDDSAEYKAAQKHFNRLHWEGPPYIRLLVDQSWRQKLSIDEIQERIVEHVDTLLIDTEHNFKPPSIAPLLRRMTGTQLQVIDITLAARMGFTNVIRDYAEKNGFGTVVKLG